MRIHTTPQPEMCPSCGDCALPPGEEWCSHCEEEMHELAEAGREYRAELVAEHPITGRIALVRQRIRMRRI